MVASQSQPRQSKDDTNMRGSGENQPVSVVRPGTATNKGKKMNTSQTGESNPMKSGENQLPRNNSSSKVNREFEEGFESEKFEDEKFERTNSLDKINEEKFEKTSPETQDGI